MANLPEEAPSGALSVDEADHFKIAQAIYNSVTGKTEKLSRSYGKDYVIKLDDFKQLDLKCKQACSQWDVLQKNCSVTVHHLDDNKEVFSSFERFKIYDASRTAATESVVYEFNLLLRLPDTEKPQPYKITVRAMSKVAFITRMEKEMGPPPFLRLFTSGHVVVEIEYVDYVVARNMVSMVDAWIGEVEQESRFSWIKYPQKYSHWLAPISNFLIVSLLGWALYQATPNALPSTSSESQLAQWLILAGTALLISGILARGLAKLIESGVDRIMPISTICLNKGDARLLEKFKRRNIWRAIQAVFAAVILIGQGVTVNWVSDVLKSAIETKNNPGAVTISENQRPVKSF